MQEGIFVLVADASDSRSNIIASAEKLVDYMRCNVARSPSH
jgi:hypothetical protein